MKIICIHDIEEAKKVWEQLSPKKHIYDDWGFRFCFYKYFNYEIYFYVGIENGEPVGLLPLQYNSEKGYLEFFGGSYMDSNQIYIKEKNDKIIPDFYKALDRPAKLIDVIGEDSFTTDLPLEDYNYMLPLNGIQTVEQLIEQRFSKRSKDTLKRKMKMLEHENITILKDQYEDLDLLIDLNIKRFGDDSAFCYPFRRETFHDLLKLPFQFKIQTFVINEEKQAVSLSIFYKGIYYYLYSGVNLEKTKNLGNYVIKETIKEAISLDAICFDAGLGDCGWKERWHLDKTPQYIYSTFKD
jgi:CelD/BcsL family acetyltransferase involved in cellulose biosynthesis